MPLQPSSRGRSSQGIPVRRTNTMPVKATRSGVLGRPLRDLRRGLGSSGSISAHSSSSTSCRATVHVEQKTCHVRDGLNDKAGSSRSYSEKLMTSAHPKARPTLQRYAPPNQGTGTRCTFRGETAGKSLRKRGSSTFHAPASPSVMRASLTGRQARERSGLSRFTSSDPKTGMAPVGWGRAPVNWHGRSPSEQAIG
jgi:hypothetical protein